MPLVGTLFPLITHEKIIFLFKGICLQLRALGADRCFTRATAKFKKPGCPRFSHRVMFGWQAVAVLYLQGVIHASAVANGSLPLKSIAAFHSSSMMIDLTTVSFSSRLLIVRG